MKILTILGARPQFIKAAAVSRAFAKLNESTTTKIEEVILHTGQHYDHNMSDIFFEELSIPRPQFNLGVGSSSHGAQLSGMISSIEKILKKVSPTCIMVYGDTNSTLAGALAASKLLIPVVHVEAGLRSFNKVMPEEQNRILTDHVSTVLFCPTQSALENLENEGFVTQTKSEKSWHINTPSILLSGDVMLDCTNYYSRISEKRDLEIKEFLEKSVIRNFALCTIHRAENTNDLDKLVSILEGLVELSKQHPIILPLHPRTEHIIESNAMLKSLSESIHIISPVSYLEMVYLETQSNLIITDSGGVQKEAFFLKKPCITLREETEWTETIKAGWNTLVGSEKQNLVDAFERVERFFGSKELNPFSSSDQFSQEAFGDGDAGGAIANSLHQWMRSI